jgi:dihydroorotase
MQLYISNAVWPEYNSKPCYILLRDERILEISLSPLTDIPVDCQTIEAGGQWLIPGLLDLGTQGGEPGLEHRETMDSLAKAAKAGGYSHLAVFPELKPITDNATAVKSLIALGKSKKIQLLPIAAASVQIDGKNMTEMMDISKAGAAGFSQGPQSDFPADLMMRTLEYLKISGSLTLTHPSHYSLIHNGQMHEGAVSTLLGLRGYPAFIEKMNVERNLNIIRYTGGRLHFWGLSTADSIPLIKMAKEEGLDVSASVAINNLLFTEEELLTYDTNFKVLPPLRSELDRRALLEGVKEGTLDCVVSAHQPWNAEAKDIEFPYAKFGSIGIQTVLSAYCTHLKEDIPWEVMIKALSDNPRKILHLPPIQPIIGSFINFSLFDPEQDWVLKEETNFSESKNACLWNKALKGRITSSYIDDNFEKH